MEVGLVQSVDIDREMQQAYLDYAMSVIVARALPDARDGLKPVHRRILYAMYDMGLRPDTAYKKSARIVGEVLGKYHPHGDLTVYEAMARMAQEFSMRTLLVEGQGNFGSVDGDPPAAMRYTEARLTPPAMDMLSDIRKETVNFSPNFDSSLEEPDVLPAAIPNLLVNGATGIAVGMSTSVPPHNLGEVVGALTHMLENWQKLDDISVEDLMRFIQGPDFPTGGLIVPNASEEGLTAAYGTGRGRVTVQARAHIEEISRGRTRIIVTELPYMTNKSSLIERIAELAREERIEGIADLRDESDRHGLRIVIELSKTAEPEKVLQDLYKSTPMRSTFSIIMLALVDGEPRMLSLKQALRVYLEHRLEVIRRRAEYDLEKARQRAHILEGLRVALRHLDEIIDLIRRSADADQARERLMKRYKLSEVQAQAILDMPLKRLAALERKKIEDEYKEVTALIKTLEALLRSPLKMRQTVAEELRLVKEAYSDRRRTQIAKAGSGSGSMPVLTVSELLPEQVVWVQVTAEGLVSRAPEDKQPRFSGTAAPLQAILVNTRDTLFLVSEQGEAAGIPVHAVPETEDPAQGAPFHKISALSDEDTLAALFTLPPKEERLEGWYVFTITRQGLVKKSELSELPGPTGRAFTLAKVNEGDALGWVRLTNGKDEVLIVTADGMAIRFSEEEVRPMGLVAAGVGAIKLGARDEVVGMELVPKKGEILLIASDGRGKRIEPAQFPVQGRYGQGVIAWKLPRTAQMAGVAAGKGTQRITLHMNRLAPKALRLDEAPLQTRAAQGKAVVDVKANDRVIALTIPWEPPRPTDRPSVLPKRPPRPEPVEAEAPPPPAARQASFTAPAEKPTRRPRATKPAAEEPAVPRRSHSRSTAQQLSMDVALPEAEPTPRRRGRTSAAGASKKAAATKRQTAPSGKAQAPAAKKPIAAQKGSARAAKGGVKPAAKAPARRTPAASIPADKKPAPKAPARKAPAQKVPPGKKPAPKAPAKKSPAPARAAKK
ncbi:MAG: DNA gyrase subunit A [Anaerolineales bacterium]|nr:DNA gyrase subunit A [Anaerolineales bacterium]